jgi:hypothetical protein
MAASQETTGQVRRGGRKVWLTRLFAWGGMLLCTTVFLPTSMVLAVGMLPSILLFLFDRTAGRPLTLTIGMLNLAGVLPALYELWKTSHSIPGAKAVLAEPGLWMFGIVASGIGVVIYLFMPPVMLAYYRVTTRNRVALLRDRQSKLVQDWGSDLQENAEVALLEHHGED